MTISWQRLLASAAVSTTGMVAGFVFLSTTLPQGEVASVADSRQPDKVLQADAPIPAEVPTVKPEVSPSSKKTPAPKVTPAPKKTPKPAPSPTPAPTGFVSELSVHPETKQTYEVVPGLPELTFRLASFNVLGSQHTAADGDLSWYPSGVIRAQWAREMMEDREYSVVGLQESQPDQVREIVSTGTWASWPNLETADSIDIAQSIVWRADQWDFVKARGFQIPFLGQSRTQPVVLLQNKATTRMVWVINVHMAPKRPTRDGEGERNIATEKLLEEIHYLRLISPYSVVVTGDMNEHEEVFCDVTGRTDLLAANGGDHTEGCVPPEGRLHVDWIFGSPNLGWANFKYSNGPRVDAITDHTVPVVDTTIPAT